MHPILFKFPEFIPLIGGRAIHVYGAMVALAFFAGLTWANKEARRLGVNHERVVDLFFYIVLSAIIGSRVLYVFASVPDWWEDPLVFIRFWEGGLVFYGGLIGAVLVSVWYMRKHKLPFFKVADIFAPGIALGHVFGRLGCFAAGCCFGREAPEHSFFAVLFPHTEYSIAPFDHPVYATQLMEASGEFLIFIFLAWFSRRKKFDGEVFLLYLILYPILRGVLEIWRGDKIRGFVIEDVLSTSQFISILWVLLAVILWVFRLKNNPKLFDKPSDKPPRGR